jgi:hypothetical protein
VGDLDADGVLDIVTGPGPGRPAPVKVFVGRNDGYVQMAGFSPFGRVYAGVVFVAAGDVDGSRADELVVATAPGPTAWPKSSPEPRQGPGPRAGSLGRRCR